MIVEDRKVQGRDHAGLVGRLGQVAIVVRELTAKIESALVLAQPRQNLRVGDLPAARLHSKIGLTQRDDILLGVGVLDNQIAGIAGKLVIFDAPLPALADRDHFADLSKMIRRVLSAGAARPDRPIDRLLEVAPLGVAEHICQIARRPELALAIHLTDALEGRDM